MLHDKLEQDLREALKAGDSLRVSTIRFLLASVKNRSIDKKADRLDDAEVISIIKKWPNSAMTR
ncbi:MAG: GatB/YqeY domain-containing protein [Candidatus Omnitrophota bacterium]